MPPTLPVMPGARPIGAASRTAVMPRNNSVSRRCGGSVAFAHLIRFPGRRMGPATPGRRVRRAKRGAGIRRIFRNATSDVDAIKGGKKLDDFLIDKGRKKRRLKR